MGRMEIVIAVTLYLTFGAFLVLPHLGAPPIFGRMAIGLCASEFVAAFGWGISRSNCGGDAICPHESNIFESAAGLQIPVLAACVFTVATAYGIFVARRW